MTDYSSMSLEEIQALIQHHQAAMEEAEAVFKKRIEGKESIILKWGTVKGWEKLSESSQKLMEEFFAEGMGVSAMMDRPGQERRGILCRLIEQLDGTIFNDWEDKYMTKEEAIKYVSEY